MPQIGRNDFGRAFARAGYRWTAELCRQDSDHDGLTNGEELGDPNCTWRFGDPHPVAASVSHPGVDERIVPFDELHVPVDEEQRANAPDEWDLFFQLVPPRDAPSMTPEAYELRIGNRVLFGLYYILFPALWLVATFVRRKHGIGISLWGWLGGWLALYAGIAIGSHRLFSHRAFEPTRWFKCVMIFLGTMTGQGEPRYWAMMHRIHHNRCEEGGDDPHSPAPSLERSVLGYGHGGFLYDRMELYELERRAPDLMDADHEVFAEGRGILTFLLLPPLLGNVAALLSFIFHHTAAQKHALPLGARMRRAAAVGFTSVCFYFYLPCVMAWQNSMLVNSAVHTWGYTLYEDAMSAPCTGKNLPLLFPFMLGENNHNNHHGEPSAASTWHLWWEADVWPVVLRGLEVLGAVQSVTAPRWSRAHPADRTLGAIRGRLDLMRNSTPYESASAPIGFWEASDDFMPIWQQVGLVALFYAAVFRWRWVALRRPAHATDDGVTAVLLAFALGFIAFGAGYMVTDVELRKVSARYWASEGAMPPVLAALRTVGNTLRALTEGEAISAADVATLALAYIACVALAVALALLLFAVAVMPAWACMWVLASQSKGHATVAGTAALAMLAAMWSAAATAADKAKVI